MKKTKIISLMIMSLFLVSMIPSAFAQSTTDDLKKLNSEILENSRKIDNQISASRTNINNVIRNTRATLNDVKKSGQVNREGAQDVKDALLELLDQVTLELEKVEVGVEHSCIENDNTNTFIRNVNTNAQNLKSRISAIDPATATRADLNIILKDIKNFYNTEFKSAFYVATGRASGCKAQYIINNGELVIDRLQDITNQASSKGVNTMNAGKILGEMRTSHKALVSEYDSLKNEWRTVDTASEAEITAKKINSFVKNKAQPTALRLYSDARNEYRNILNSLTPKGEPITLSGTVTSRNGVTNVNTQRN